VTEGQTRVKQYNPSQLEQGNTRKFVLLSRPKRSLGDLLFFAPFLFLLLNRELVRKTSLRRLSMKLGTVIGNHSKLRKKVSEFSKWSPFQIGRHAPKKSMLSDFNEI